MAEDLPKPSNAEMQLVPHTRALCRTPNTSDSAGKLQSRSHSYLKKCLPLLIASHIALPNTERQLVLYTGPTSDTPGSPRRAEEIQSKSQFHMLILNQNHNTKTINSRNKSRQACNTLNHASRDHLNDRGLLQLNFRHLLGSHMQAIIPKLQTTPLQRNGNSLGLQLRRRQSRRCPKTASWHNPTLQVQLFTPLRLNNELDRTKLLLRILGPCYRRSR